MLTYKNNTNVIVWQINTLKRLLAKIRKKIKRVLFIILKMCSIYTIYLNQFNKANKRYDKIRIYILKFE